MIDKIANFLNDYAVTSIIVYALALALLVIGYTAVTLWKREK